MTDDKPKIVNINSKAEKEAEQTQEAKEESMSDLLEQVMGMVFSQEVDHLIVITQSKDRPNMLLAAGDSSELQLYRMYHYLNTKASGDYDYGISYIMGELEDDED